MYEKVVSVIAKPMEERSDIECMDLVSWFRNKSSLFRSLKAGESTQSILLDSKYSTYNVKLYFL